MRRYPLALLVLLYPRTAFADLPTPLPLFPIPAGTDTILHLPKGQPAPFEGQLFDPPTALRWANYLRQCTSRLKADVEYQHKLDVADTEYAKAERDIERVQHKKVAFDLENRLRDAEHALESPPFYKSVWFGVALGVVGTAAIVGVTAAALQATH